MKVSNGHELVRVLFLYRLEVFIGSGIELTFVNCFGGIAWIDHGKWMHDW